MKPDIHPHWNPQVTVTCACGNSFISGSTQDEIRVEICSQCHPFFTGKEKLVDIEGRVDRFQKKAAHAAKIKKATVSKRRQEQLRQDKETHRPKTLKEMLQKIKTQRKTGKETRPDGHRG